jgi:cytochrome c oxidase cbb3-type subunit 3
MKKNKLDKQKQVETTGHSWDGIEEYQNPDPKWLRYAFYAAVLFSIGYWLLYPSWPAPNTYGALKWSSAKQVTEDLREIEKKRSVYQGQFDKASFSEILQSPELMKFALAGGQSAFHNNCAMCHGSNAQGFPWGYPNLTDNDWIWGGKIEDIYHTIKHGIRSGDDEARESQMAAFVKDKIITAEEAELLTDYVLALYKATDKNPQADNLFQTHCASCHGVNGEGKYEFGAPTLNDAIWLYGSDRQTILDVITNGRGGMMPAWHTRLDDATIRKLAVYIYSLGGGE